TPSCTNEYYARMPREQVPILLPQIIFCGWMLLTCTLPCTSFSQVPINDICIGAIALTNGIPYPMNTCNATSVGDPTDCLNNQAKGVWFTYTPIADGPVVVDTCGSSFTTALGVYSNACGSLVKLGCGYY